MFPSKLKANLNYTQNWEKKKKKKSHKTFAHKTAFPSSDLKRTKSKFMINWRYISVRKMEVDAVGEAPL